MNNDIKLYAAPLEGLTGYVWRKAHDEIFGGADRYFTPFVVANQTRKFKTKELRDLSQNEEKLVPQILTDKSEHFIWAAGELKAMGYEEINFNLGCPSATVVTRGKGSGILRDKDALDRMLSEIYEGASDIKISIKTRIGFADSSDWDEILSIFEKYPVHELIIHPRFREQYYKGQADRELFKDTLQKSKLKLVYNGDINDPGDEALEYGCNVMAGRGLIGNPALFREMRGGAKASADEIKQLHEKMIEYYADYMQGDGPVIHHMKEMWTYMGASMNCDEKLMKQLKKAKKMNDFMSAVRNILSSCSFN